MSQFRLTGTYYVSEWNGDPLNDGTDPDTPFSHPADYGTSGTTNKGIIGSGNYNGFWTGSRFIEGDGKVILDGKGASTPNASQILNNLILQNVNLVSSGTFTSSFNDVTFINCNQISFRTNVLRCAFLDNFTSLSSNPSVANAYNSMFFAIQSIGVRIGRFENCFIAKNAKIRHDSTLQDRFINNMVNGIYVANNNLEYESKRLFDGSARPDADPLILDVIDIFPNFYSQGNFSGDPKIIDVLSRTVEPNSDLLKRSNSNGFIGGVKIGEYIRFNNPNFLITYQNIDQSNPDLLRIANGFDFGKIRITGKISDTLISSQKVDIRIPFFFDSSEIGGTEFNNDVPDAVHGLRGIDTLGDLPYRLRFEVRSSQLANANRNNNDDWDNDISGIPGRWYLMEYGQPMLHHMVAGVAYGNADKFAINAVTKVPFNYRSLDIEITLSNDRSQV